MKNKILLCSLAAALVVGGFTVPRTFAAEKSGGAPAPLRGKILQRLADRLELTADQRSQIKSILEGERENLKPLLIALHDARTNLRAAIHAAEANETSVRAASAKVASAEADLAVERLKISGKIAPILTAEQRQKISEFEARVDEFASHARARLGEGRDE